jgi:hypothetical protein
VPESQVPHVIDSPQAFWIFPHVIFPQLSGAHVAHTPWTHWPPGQLPHVTFALPQVFGVDEQRIPPSGAAHSGASGPQIPPEHVSPAAQEQAIECPHPSVTVPQRCVCASGVHETAPHWPASTETGGPAGMQCVPTQSSPAGQPPHVIATPQPSSPTTPHRPSHAFAWQVCDDESFGSMTHTVPASHGSPHAKTCPEHGSVKCPH